MNSNGSQGNSFAQAAAPITQTSAPMTGAFNQSSGGVFLFQNPSFNPQLPNYSVGFPSQSVTVGGTNHQLYLLNWSANGANIQNAASSQTGVEFTSTSGVVTANVKGSLLSDNVNSISNNNQRKFIRTPDGAQHIVYESLGHVWYEMSWDNDTTWKIMNNGQQLTTAPASFLQWTGFIFFTQVFTGYCILCKVS